MALVKQDQNRNEFVILTPEGDSPFTIGGLQRPKINPKIDAELNVYIEKNPAKAAYIQGLPRETLERKCLLNMMNKEKQQEGYDKKVTEFINRPENVALKESLVKSLSPNIQSSSELNRAILKEAKIQIHKQGIKMSL